MDSYEFRERYKVKKHELSKEEREKQEQEKINKIRQTAYEAVEEVIQKLKTEGKDITKQTIIEQLPDEIKYNDDYRTSVVVWCHLNKIPNGEIEQEL